MKTETLIKIVAGSALVVILTSCAAPAPYATQASTEPETIKTHQPYQHATPSNAAAQSGAAMISPIAH